MDGAVVVLVLLDVLSVVVVVAVDVWAQVVLVGFGLCFSGGASAGSLGLLLHEGFDLVWCLVFAELCELLGRVGVVGVDELRHWRCWYRWWWW